MEQVISPLTVHILHWHFFIKSKKCKKENQVLWLNLVRYYSREKLNSEMSAEIRSKPSLPICIPRSAHQDYFYLQDFGWYHFSKWECASAAWVIHLGSFDNFLWNVCAPYSWREPQHTGRDEYLCKGKRPGEQFVIKGILWKYIHKPLCSPARYTPSPPNAITDTITSCSSGGN